MTRRMSFLLLALVLLCLASPVFAQEPVGGAPAAPSNTQSWVALTSGFAMAIASGLCGLAQGRATAAAAEGMARNPAARPGIQFALILGLALIESLALYTFVIIFIKVTATP